MKLKTLFKNIPIKEIKGSKDVDITGICVNSKLVAPGKLFIAKKGFVDDGNRYIAEAVAAGASAILTDIYDPSLKTTQVISPHVADLEGRIAAHYYHYPSQDLFMVGITGTNGKTTTSYLIKHLLDSLKCSCGLIGTIEYIIGQHRYEATRTTPDVVSNQKMLREMIIQNCTAAVMEVTSHALDQGRVQYIEYDVVVFTNLTVDHLDYHKTIDNYANTKKKLFDSIGNDGRKKNIKTAVVNSDSPWHKQMIADSKAKVLTYAIDRAADLQATDIVLNSQGTRFNLIYQGQIYPCESSLVGRFNVYNILAALCVGIAKKTPIEELIVLIKTFPAIAGRLEFVSNPLSLKIFVDFAHSGDALNNVLRCLRELNTGRIITVFGCGGDRDPNRRYDMAKASDELSDFSIITSDNPRSEDPNLIANQIASGFSNKDHYMIELDRETAIKAAIDRATAQDIILIAGKGHEPYQIFAHKTIEFDDRQVALQICQKKIEVERN